MPSFTLGTTIEVRDILTSVSVLIALVGFLYAMSKDRGLKNREYCDRVRAGASVSISRLDRYRLLLLFFYDKIQPCITEADTIMATTGDGVKSRDYFWKSANEIRISILDECSKEQLEIAYASLLGYRPEIYERFNNAINEIRDAGIETFYRFQESCQEVFFLISGEQRVHSAIVGNELRAVCAHHKSIFDDRSEMALAPTRGFLRELIASSDQAIIRGSKNPRLPIAAAAT